jgi:hypothetical protein
MNSRKSFTGRSFLAATIMGVPPVFMIGSKSARGS